MLTSLYSDLLLSWSLMLLAWQKYKKNEDADVSSIPIIIIHVFIKKFMKNADCIQVLGAYADPFLSF